VWRVWDVTNSRKWAPRGSQIATITASGPDWVQIYPDGTMRVQQSLDSQRFRDDGTWGSLVLQPGATYEIQVGHTEPFVHLPYPYAACQRWNSDADGNLDWFPGDAIP
jgi:hypothetical protein